MKRILTLSLFLLIFINIVLGYLYIRNIPTFKIAKKWTDVEQNITTNCKIFPETTLSQKQAYPEKLLEIMNNTDNFLFPPISSDNILNQIMLFKNESVCLALFSGNIKGKGIVIYETELNEIVMIKVKEFPSSLPQQ